MRRPWRATCSRILAKFFGFASLFTIISCADSTYSKYRDQRTEELIKSFFSSNRERLEITSLTGGLNIDAYCVLGTYESDLNEKDNRAVQANAFLKQINLFGEEDYWHIVVRSSDQFILIRINQRSTPLLPKTSDWKNSCNVGKALIVKKRSNVPNQRQTIEIGN